VVENSYTRCGIQVSEWVSGWVDGVGGCGRVGCSHSTVTTPNSWQLCPVCAYRLQFVELCLLIILARVWNITYMFSLYRYRWRYRLFTHPLSIEAILLHECTKYSNDIFSANATTWSLMDFVVSPPGCSRSVTDFWGWNEVDGDIWIWSTMRALNLSSTKLPRPCSPWEPSPSRKNPLGRTGNWTRDLMISSQKLWPLDHEAGIKWQIISQYYFQWQLSARIGINTE
jgi:hypothetical protein